MLRTNAFRVVRAASRPNIACIAVTPAHTYNHFIRFESTKAEKPPQTDTAKEAWRKARTLKDKLNHNWDAATLTYEQVKPKTLSPSPVRSSSLSFFTSWSLTQLLTAWALSDRMPT